MDEERSDKICPKIQKKLEKAKSEAASNICRHSNDKRFEMQYIYGGTYVVDLESCTCTCKRWQLTGLPCSHAVACISLTREQPEDFVHKCYSRDAYLAAYDPTIAPISGPNAWRDLGKEPVLPPKKLRLPGRPKKTRKRELDEPRTTSKGGTKLSRVGVTGLSCSNCHEKGHTIRKCLQIVPLEQLAAQGNGRGHSFSSNKCSHCNRLGHNKRTCPDSQSKGQASGVTPDLNMNTTGEQVRGEFDGQNAGGEHATIHEETTCIGSTNEQQNASTEDNVSLNNQQSVPSIVPNHTAAPRKTLRCYFCRAIGHNKKTCPSQQAVSWRKRKAEMDSYGPYVESVGKRPRTKQKAHRLIDERENENQFGSADKL